MTQSKHWLASRTSLGPGVRLQLRRRVAPPESPRPLTNNPKR